MRGNNTLVGNQSADVRSVKCWETLTKISSDMQTCFYLTEHDIMLSAFRLIDFIKMHRDTSYVNWIKLSDVNTVEKMWSNLRDKMHLFESGSIPIHKKR